MAMPSRGTSETHILKLVFQNESITRADIGELSGLSPASVVRIVAGLRDAGFLLETRKPGETSNRGRPSDVLQIAPDCGYALGLEFGRGHLIVSVVDAIGTQVHWGQETEAPSFAANDATADALVQVIKKTADRLNIRWEKVGAIGLAVHDVVSAKGEWITWEQAHHTPYNVQHYLQREMNRPVSVEDVSRAFAEAEHRYGNGRGVADMIYMFVGSQGVGAGVFINNVLMKSSSGVCGEIGHIVVEKDGALCQCGNYGCLETVATHKAVVNQLQARLDQGVISTLSRDEGITFAKICQAAQEGDKEAYIVLRRLAGAMGKALSSAINITGATFVLIGGQLRFAGDSFLTDLISELRQNVMPALAQHISVNYAALAEYAGALGVAAQALETAWASGEFLNSPS